MDERSGIHAMSRAEAGVACQSVWSCRVERLAVGQAAGQAAEAVVRRSSTICFGKSDDV